MPCQRSLQRQRQKQGGKSHRPPLQITGPGLTQMSEFFSLPPLALFRSRIQVAFMSQAASFSSAAAAPPGAEPQCALSPKAPQIRSYPCSGQTPLLRPLQPPGLSLPSPEEELQSPEISFSSFDEEGRRKSKPF